jgi:hypothetical protein
VISVFGSDFCKVHQPFPVNRKWILKAVVVPKLEQSHVKANMRRAECVVLLYDPEKNIQMADVIHSLGASSTLLHSTWPWPILRDALVF